MNQRHYTVELLGKANRSEIWAVCELLAIQMRPPSYFCGGEWLRAVSRAVRDETEINIFVVRNAGEIRAVLPLQAITNGLGGRDLHFLGATYYPDPIGLITGSNESDCVWAALKEGIHTYAQWDRVVLDCMLDKECNRWKESRVKTTVQPFLALPGSIDEILSKFGKKKRYNIRTAVRKAESQGCELLRATSATDRVQILAELYELHSKRAREKGLKSTFSGRDLFELHRDLVRESDHSRLYALRKDGRTIAALYGFVFENSFFDYQIAHDPKYGNLGPGSVLLYKVIEDCCRQGLREFNFLQGDEEYKSYWATDSRDLFKIVLYSGTLRSRMLKALAAGRAAVKRIINGIAKN